MGRERPSPADNRPAQVLVTPTGQGDDEAGHQVPTPSLRGRLQEGMRFQVHLREGSAVPQSQGVQHYPQGLLQL